MGGDIHPRRAIQPASTSGARDLEREIANCRNRANQRMVDPGGPCGSNSICFPCSFAFRTLFSRNFANAPSIY